jgi:hypothetical protein
MNVFLPTFLIQTLRKRSKLKFGSRRCRRGRITAQGCGIASEEERTALTEPLIIVDRLASERCDRLLREGFLSAATCVVERYADVGCRPVCVTVYVNVAEGGFDCFVGVLGYHEHLCLC